MTAEGSRARAAPGRITAVDSVVDEATRNVQVAGDARQPRADACGPGMFVQTQVVARTRRAPVVTLPASADQLRALRRLGVRGRADSKGPRAQTYKGVRQQFVKLGGARGDQVAVLSGLEDGRGGRDLGRFQAPQRGRGRRSTTRSSPRTTRRPKPEDN